MGLFSFWENMYRRVLREESAKELAHKLGLVHAGGGYWADASGEIVAKTIDDKLVRLEKGEEIPADVNNAAKKPAQTELPLQPSEPAPETPTEEPKVDNSHMDSWSADELRAFVESRGHTLDDTINGKFPVLVKKFDPEEVKQAQQAGLMVKAIIKGKLTLYAKDEAAAKPMLDFFKKGGKFGSTECMRLMGYDKQEVGAYTRFLKKINRWDLLGKGTGNQYTGGGGVPKKPAGFNVGDYPSGAKSLPTSQQSWWNTGGYVGGKYDPENAPHTAKPTPTPEGGVRFTKDDQVPAELNGIPFAPWEDAPKTIEEWQKVDGQMPELHEPPSQLTLKKLAAGVIIREPDGRIWVVEPKNHFMGTEHTFPKGGEEKGLNLQQTAIKEAFEETGLKVKITGFFGDYDRDTSIGRYYTAERVGGTPNGFHWETYSTKLVPPSALPELMNRLVDKQIGKEIANGKKAEPTTAKEIMAKQVGGKAGTNAGGMFMGTDGKERYVKFYNDPARAYGETLASEIYRAVGVGAPRPRTFEVNGKIGYASDKIEGTELYNVKLDQKLARNILDGFVFDVLLVNWDAVGTGRDNIKIDPEGKVYRIDQGGSFHFRAQEVNGYKKTDLKGIPEWEGYANPNVNHFYAGIFKEAGYAKPEDMGWDLIDQVDDMKRLYNKIGGWDKLVEHFAPKMDPKDKAVITAILESRSKAIIDKANALEKTLPKRWGGNWSSGSAGASAYNGWSYGDWGDDWYPAHGSSGAVGSTVYKNPNYGNSSGGQGSLFYQKNTHKDDPIEDFLEPYYNTTGKEFGFTKTSTMGKIVRDVLSKVTKANTKYGRDIALKLGVRMIVKHFPDMPLAFKKNVASMVEKWIKSLPKKT